MDDAVGPHVSILRLLLHLGSQSAVFVKSLESDGNLDNEMITVLGLAAEIKDVVEVVSHMAKLYLAAQKYITLCA